MRRVEEPTLEALVAAWFKSPEATRYAESQLRRNGLYLDSGEVIVDTHRKVWESIHRAGKNAAIVSVEAYCRTAIKRRVIDLLRGVISERKQAEARESREVRFGHAAEPVAAPLVDIVGSALGDALRSAIEASGHTHPAVSSAALTFVTLSQYPNVDIAEAPTPLAGSRPDQARMWPSLWFAGTRDGIFPTGEQNDASQRQRLGRAARKVTQMLDAAAAACRVAGVVG